MADKLACDIQALGHHDLMQLQDGAVLVFGLTWSPLIGSHPDALARRKARETHATHYVHGGVGAASAGCARLRGRAKACYAAAQVFAGMHPHGIAAGLLPLEGGRVWLAASRNGAVMARGDRVYSSEAAALEALAELDAMHPGLASERHDLALDDLAASIGPAACLWRVGMPLRHLPLPVQGTALLLVLALLLPPAWRAWRGGGAVHPRPSAIDAAQAWRDALARTAAAVRVHDPEQLGRVFAALKSLPRALQGWTMRSARCRPNGQDWACVARYARTAPDATNHALARTVPAAARTVFPTLDEAEILWSLAGHAGSLQPDRLPDAGQTDLVFTSALQAIRPAFARISLGAPTAVAVVPPRDEQGRPLPAPADLTRLRRRNVAMHGPLRSFALFAQPPATLSWTGVAVDFHDGHQADIAQSPLMAQLEGVLYERE